MAFESGTLQKDTFYRVGDLNESNSKICWRKEKAERILRNSRNPSVSINDRNLVTFSVSNSRYHSFIAGHINTESTAELYPDLKLDSTMILNPILDPNSRDHNSNESTVSVNNHGHIVSAQVRDETHIKFFNGREHHTLPISNRPLQESQTSLRNPINKIRSLCICVNGHNTVAFSCHTVHGFMEREKVVTTYLGRLRRKT